jgi:hypothetical protein
LVFAVSRFSAAHADAVTSQLPFLVSFTHHKHNEILTLAFSNESYLFGAKFTALSVIVIFINFKELLSFTVFVLIFAILVIV